MSNKVVIVSQGVTQTDEALVTGTPKPGHLVEINSLSRMILQATASVKTQVLILMENDLVGEGVTDAYADGDRARAAILNAGDRAYIRLAESVTVKVGQKLESAGAGQFKAYSAGVPLVRAMEAATSASADDFLLVEVL
jgi:hypothetical protein